MKASLKEELNIANKELAFQNNVKEKRAAALVIANKELAFQNIEKENHASELAIANEEIRTILENSGIGLILMDEHFTILQINNMAVQLCELAVGIKFKTFDNFLVTVPAWRKEDLKKLYSKVMKGESLQYESVYPGPDGTKLILNVNFIPTKNNDGNVIGACLSMEDITERKNSDERILKSEKRFRALIEHGVDMKTLTSKEGKVLYCSQSVKKSLGYSLTEFLHIYPQNLIHPDDIESYVQKLDDILKTPGKSFDFKQRRLHKNGKWIWCEGTVTNLLEEDSIHALVSNFRDITERKVAEQAIIESEKEIRTMAESMPQMVWVTTGESKNIFFNHQWVVYTGLTLEESYGDGWLIPFHEDDKPLARKAWNNAVINLAEYTVECRLRKYDGSYHWWLIRGVPKINEKGEIEKWYGTCTDIEKIKLAGEQLRKSEAKFRHLMESVPTGLIGTNKEGIIVYANMQASILFGYPIDELLNNKVEMLLPEQFRGIHENNRTGYESKPTTREMGKVGMPLYGRRKDGSEFATEISLSSIESEDGLVVLSAIRDITEKKKAENKLIVTSIELQRALSDITKIMDSSLDVICAVDAKGNFLKVSAASEAVWGYKPEELIGKPLINFVYHEDNEKTLAELKVRIAKTLDFVGTVKPEQFVGAETREIVLKFPQLTLKFNGQDYVTKFALPNFYFHLTMAYAVLRKNGVELGKGDFLGAI
ncbi:MAG: DUF1993 family protein, partial [Bacteroidia bacterium]|nr:DUF1993 family protein [Bacteroidia bacterium]